MIFFLNSIILIFRRSFSFLLFTVLIVAAGNKAIAQCPTNIDFENGNFGGWQCWKGIVEIVAGKNKITWDATSPGGPFSDRHTMLSSNPGNGIDTFGLFPQNCPNGSGNSIKLGNALPGHQAEGVSYTFTIPPGQNKFNLIYQYAVVLQGPGHLPEEQPRLSIKVENLSDATDVGCSSFSFIPPSFTSGDADLPGFFLSSNTSTGTPVWCKSWSANSINLDGNAGKTIRLFFTSADCIFAAHFGYAYIDVNTECSSSFVGANFCHDDTLVKITAPFGYRDYTWFNKDYSQILGNQQILTLSPPPLSGDSVKVVLNPYSGYGCIDTLTANLLDTLTIKANAGFDVSPCNFTPVQLGAAPVPGLFYKWSPAKGLDNPDIANPIATPSVPTAYILTVKSSGGGCASADTVQVNPKIVNNTVNLIGNTIYCIGSGPYPVLRVNKTDSIQWFKDSIAIAGANQIQYTINQTGKYFAQLFSNTCPLPISTKETSMVIDSPLPGVIYPAQDAIFNFPLQLQVRQFGNSALWTPATSLDKQNSYTPIFRGISKQLYTIQIKTASGCLTVDTQLVTTRKKIEIYVPSAFTPGGDGKNDYLRPVLMGIVKVNYFRIYNRWGHLLFEMKSDLPGWNGKVNNQSQEIQTVVWLIEAVDVDGKIHRQKGTTVLYR